MTTLDYAKKELTHYMDQITQESHAIELTVDLLLNTHSKESPQSPFDDVYHIDIVKGNGVISGNHERAVLLGVYAFLEAIGCRFLTPSLRDEVIVKKALEDITIKTTIIPQYRHRALCIEGAVSIDHVLAMIKWAPKVGFNGYFIQFQNPHEFFQRYYEHRRNPNYQGLNHPLETSKDYHQRMIKAIKETGLMHHAVGHGWTMESLGFDAMGWQKMDESVLSDRQRLWLAEIDGSRTFFKGVPLDTQLCYSNPDVRQTMADKVVDYILDHDDIDILHVWLADNFNNFCECTTCQESLPVNYYIMILNAIDERLTQLNHPAKIVFLVYFELRWPPNEIPLNNPDRFILMFAPITRSFTSSYPLELSETLKNASVATPFKLNKNTYSADIEENLSYLFNWQKYFQGDSFLFDYHYMWDVYKDVTSLKLSKVLHQDIKALKTLGLNGFVSCQVQRNFAPSGFHMALLAKALVNPNLDYDVFKQTYFDDMYGEDASWFLSMLEAIDTHWSHAYMRCEVSMINDQSANDFDQVHTMCMHFTSQLQSKPSTVEKTHDQRTWYNHYLEMVGTIAQLMSLKATGASKEVLESALESFHRLVFSKEEAFSLYYDAYYLDFIITEITNQQW